MATTTNFGWETPDDTDLVKDGAAAIRTLGQSIDTSLMDLEGGTTGQVLSKASNTDMDFTWVTSDDANAIQNAIMDAKGDLIAATAADTPARLAVGTNGQVLTADSTAATGIKWSTVSASGFSLITNSPFSAVSSHSINNCFTSTYTNYKVIVNLTGASATTDINFRLRASGTDTSSGYNTMRLMGASGGGVIADLNQTVGTTYMLRQFLDGANSELVFGTFEIYSPQKATNTAVNASFGQRQGTGEYYVGPQWGMQTGTTQFDGITIFASAGNITGSIKVYGFGE
jgi:hypothetical protein